MHLKTLSAKWQSFGLSLKVLIKCPCPLLQINSSPPSAAYMRQRTRCAMVQVMARRLFGAKPLPEPMLIYCQLDP